MRKTINREVFAQRLKELMDENNKTIYDIGDDLALSAATISRYTTETISPKITTIEAMARLFRVNPVWLMGYDVDKYSVNQPKELPPAYFRLAERFNNAGVSLEDEDADTLFDLYELLKKHNRSE